jgi:hypothetical protein
VSQGINHILSSQGFPGKTNGLSAGGVLPRRKRPQAMFMKNPSFFNIDPKRKVMYRNFHDISGSVYLTEISKNDKKVFIILFPNFEKPDIFINESLNDKIFQKLLSDNNYGYDSLIKNNFNIKYGKLLIKNYNHGHAQDPRTKHTNGNAALFP